MFKGRVEAVFLATQAGAAMRPVAEARAVAGRGLEGDRYFAGTGRYSEKGGPGRQVTLIEAETIEALRREGLESHAAESRRNIVTRDVPLNHLVGREFRVGHALLRGVKLCEPCAYLEEVTGRPLRVPLVHRGGLNAEVLSEAVIRVGDAIEPA